MEATYDLAHIQKGCATHMASNPGRGGPALGHAHRRDESGNPRQWVFPPLGIPAATYTRVKDQTVRLEVDYWLTLAQVASSQAIPAIDADQIVPGAGRCRTKLNAAETAVQLSCAAGVTIAACVNSFLEHVPTGQRNPNQFGCGNYAPFVLNPVVNPALIPFAVNFPFRDPSALAQFPVDGSKLRASRAVFQMYRVLDHFTRKVVIPDVRLSEWIPEAPSAFGFPGQALQSPGSFLK
jgi:hypothetical protein